MVLNVVDNIKFARNGHSLDIYCGCEVRSCP